MFDKHRRQWIHNNLATLTAIGTGCALPANTLFATESPILRKQIPRTDESLPVVGMGTWITFDVPDQSHLRAERARVLQTFVDLGGGMIDSSPMYGYAEEVLGEGIAQLSTTGTLFNASKIWTPFDEHAIGQMRDTEQRWGVSPMDLMYVHNLRNWESHLPKLQQWKDEGRIRYIGLSTSHGRRHEEMEYLLNSEFVDFVQLTLNIENTDAEQRLIPLAQNKGVAVVANRPFQRGALFKKYANQPLPGVGKELGCQNWAQFFLLYVVSNPGVTCTIPATSKVVHMQENMGALQLTMPDARTRTQMREALSV